MWLQIKRIKLSRSQGIAFLLAKTVVSFFCVFLCLLIPRFVLAADSGDAVVVGSIADARTCVPILASDTASADIVNEVFSPGA